jgi:hypothetical protein
MPLSSNSTSLARGHGASKMEAAGGSNADSAVQASIGLDDTESKGNGRASLFCRAPPQDRCSPFYLENLPKENVGDFLQAPQVRMV